MAAQQAQLEQRQQEEQAAERQESQRESIRQQRREEERAAEQAAARRMAAQQAQLEQRQQEEQTQARRSMMREANRAARQESGVQTPTPASNPLQDRIPSGILSGTLPWLQVSGNRIVNPLGDPVTLRGVNLLGMENAEPDSESGFAAGAGITEETIATILTWGVNVIRVAINRSRVLNGYGEWSGWDYLTDLDSIIQQAASGGAYTLLSLRQLDDVTIFGTTTDTNGQRVPNYIAPQPDYDAIGMWRLLGERYADEPSVLFDLYTAPHAPLPDDLTGYDSDWDLWTLWVQMMVAELRRMHPRALCFVSGLANGTDIRGFPILGTANQAIPNLIYTVHLYPQFGGLRPDMQTLHRTYPLFVTEWGGRYTNLTWGERIAQSLQASAIGWTAAHWNAEPLLANRVKQQIIPTAFGLVVQRALALTGEPLAARRSVLPATRTDFTFI
jgi:hypothetical protein